VLGVLVGGIVAAGKSIIGGLETLAGALGGGGTTQSGGGCVTVNISGSNNTVQVIERIECVSGSFRGAFTF